jgi:hypothetical protein
MAQFGSGASYTSGNLSATQDPNGNPIISPDNSFGASPLGVAARTQALYGLPNGHFDLTCPDPNSAVEVNNAIPYWSLETNGTITSTMVFDATTQNWSVRIDPTGAASGDYAILKSRTYLLNDDALALRQKAYASLTKQGTTGTAQWSIVLSATYFDQTGAQLSTYNIGTAADTGTWTGINGITTSGSAAISTSAAYADIALTLTAAGSVSGTAKVDVNSVLIATSQAAAGGSFLIAQTFTSSGTWTRPTGVDYVAVLAVGAGGGGASGDARLDDEVGGFTTQGGGKGGAGAFVIVRDLYVGDQATVSVGVGSGGAGGTAVTASKASGVTTQPISASGASGATGGNSTFGSYLTAGGGVGAAGGAPGNGGTATSVFYGATLQNGAEAGIGTAITKFPYVSSIGTGVNGAASSVSITGTTIPTRVYTATAGSAGAAYANSGVGGAGGGGALINLYSTGGTVRVSYTGTAAAGAGAFGFVGAGGAGGGCTAGTTQPLTTATAGGTATVGSGGSGGGAGAVISDRYTGTGSNLPYRDAAMTATSGAGGSGAAGFVTVVWVG